MLSDGRRAGFVASYPGAVARCRIVSSRSGRMRVQSSRTASLRQESSRSRGFRGWTHARTGRRASPAGCVRSRAGAGPSASPLARLRLPVSSGPGGAGPRLPRRRGGLAFAPGRPRLDHSLERVESSIPEVPVLARPLRCFAERRRIERDAMFAASPRPLQEASALQHAHVLRNRGEAHVEAIKAQGSTGTIEAGGLRSLSAHVELTPAACPGSAARGTHHAPDG